MQFCQEMFMSRCEKRYKCYLVTKCNLVLKSYLVKRNKEVKIVKEVKISDSDSNIGTFNSNDMCFCVPTALTF